jgi:hypothetical protein
MGVDVVVSPGVVRRKEETFLSNEANKRTNLV